MEMGLGMLLMESLQAFLKRLVTDVTFQNGQRLGSGLAIGSEEADAMTVTCGVDANADGIEISRLRHDSSAERGKRAAGRPPEMAVIAGSRESPPENLWQGKPCDKRSRPQDVPKPYAKVGGGNLQEEVKASWVRKSSPRTPTIIAGGLK
jgi:hypothetical protein